MVSLFVQTLAGCKDSPRGEVSRHRVRLQSNIIIGGKMAEIKRVIVFAYDNNEHGGGCNDIHSVVSTFE